MPIHKKYVKEITLYTLDEMLADSKLKANLLEANEENEQFLNISLEQDAEDIEAELESKGFQDVKVYYDLSGCQGSGVYFTFDGVNILKLMQKEKSIYHSAYIIKYAFKDWGRKLRQLYSYVGIRTIQNHWSNHNCHSRCVDIEFNYSNIDFTEEEYSESFKRFETDFNDLYQNLCHDIYKQLAKSLEYYTSEEFLIEDLKARDCDLFLENGQVYYEEETNNSQYIILDQKGKVFSYKTNRDPLDGDFIDISDDIDLGLSKAVVFMTADEANEFIVDNLITDYSIMSVDKVSRKEGNNGIYMS